MELNIMEWNIHQKGRQYSNGRSADNPIPDWIIDEVQNDMNIVVFTEFNSHARNISDIYSKLKAKGFSYYSTKYECPWSNDILIAIRGEQIEVKSTSAVDAYPNSSITDRFDDIPENMRVDICVNEKDIHIWGIRIKDLKSDYKKRKLEMDKVMEWLKATGGISIIVGDFNNLRENTYEKEWNLKVLDNLLGDSFKRETPSNCSWGVSLSNGKFDGYIKNDHLICSKELDATVKLYEWSFIKQCNYKLNEPYYGQQSLIIPDCEPDHGILIGSVKFRDRLVLSEP